MVEQRPSIGRQGLISAKPAQGTAHAHDPCS